MNLITTIAVAVAVASFRAIGHAFAKVATGVKGIAITTIVIAFLESHFARFLNNSTTRTEGVGKTVSDWAAIDVKFFPKGGTTFATNEATQTTKPQETVERSAFATIRLTHLHPVETNLPTREKQSAPKSWTILAAPTKLGLPFRHFTK